MNFTIVLILLFAFWNFTNAQNLIPNGDFEQYSQCPRSGTGGQFDKVLYWINPTETTPDYYHECVPEPATLGVPDNFMGYQYPRSGAAYAGIILWASYATYREYIESPLTSELVQGQCYRIEFYASSSHAMGCISSDVQVYLSGAEINGFDDSEPLPYLPQLQNPSINLTDTMNWTPISFDYVAQGGENYITIGNFKYDDSTHTVSCSQPEKALIYIDDVSVTETSCITGFEDSENVGEFKVNPNPFTSQLNVNGARNRNLEIIIFNFRSQQMLRKKIWGSTSVNTAHLNPGIYIYEIRSESATIDRGKILKQ